MNGHACLLLQTKLDPVSRIVSSSVTASLGVGGRQPATSDDNDSSASEAMALRPDLTIGLPFSAILEQWLHERIMPSSCTFWTHPWDLV